MGLSTALYVTVPEVKSEIDIPSTRADFDLSIQVTVESICRQIDDYTGHVFYSATGTRYYTPTESTRLRVDDLLRFNRLFGFPDYFILGHLVLLLLLRHAYKLTQH